MKLFGFPKVLYAEFPIKLFLLLSPGLFTEFIEPNTDLIKSLLAPKGNCPDEILSEKEKINSVQKFILVPIYLSTGSKMILQMLLCLNEIYWTKLT